MANRGRPPLKKELSLKGLPEFDVEIIKRLLRAKGQIDGVLKMVVGQDDLLKIILQFKATKAAVNQAGRIYASHYLSKMARRAHKERKYRRMIRKLVKELARY